MSSRPAAAVVTTVFLAACGGGGPSGPPGLAYGLPNPAAITYVMADTSVMDIDAGGQAMQATVASAVTLGATFAPAAEGVQVTLEVKDLAATVGNPMGSQSADESGITGPLVVSLDRRGAATVVSQPQLTDVASQFFQPLSVAHGRFPRLPGRAAAVGESWTDTIRYEGSQGPGSVKALSVVTYTVAGDSVVDGRSLVKLALKGTSESSATGVITGMDFSQAVTGSVTGWVLWDQQRRLMVESYADQDGKGTMEVSAAPFPLGLRMKTQSRVKLQPIS
ncbi:MAG: hypothetical protein FIA95_03890 [Gemmatimonadetes bacterium]|nr:hypothetical protein [Gemmatimonadota bacterium]